MTFVLSIIAEPPPFPPAGQNAAASPQAPAPVGGAIQDGNRAIEEIVAMMKDARTKVPYTALSVRATYVRDIAKRLLEINPDPKHPKQPVDIIQLIGHGSAGRVELGSYWKDRPLDRRKGSAVLDSNPDSYGILTDTISAGTSVFLLGCHVGADSPSGFVASGKALLFDLEDLTKANFYAAPDLVFPAQFEDGFLYRGPLVTRDGKPANPAAIVNAQGTTTNVVRTETAPPPKLLRLISAPALGIREPDAEAASKLGLPGELGSYVSTTPPGPLLAMAELVYEAENYRRVEAICGLRYLRAETLDGQVKYFEHPAAATTKPYKPPTFASPLLDALRAS